MVRSFVQTGLFIFALSRGSEGFSPGDKPPIVRRRMRAARSQSALINGGGGVKFANEVSTAPQVALGARSWATAEEAPTMGGDEPCAKNVTVHSVLQNGRHVGKTGLGTMACEDMYHAKWVNKPTKGQWMVEPQHAVSHGPYECGDCSAHCRKLAAYDNTGIEKCDTRTLAAPPILNCKAIKEKRDPIKLSFFGSSHTRVLFFHVYRLLAGVPWPEKLPDVLLEKEHGGSANCYAHQNYTFDFCDGNVRVELFYFFKHFYRVGGDDAKFLEFSKELNFSKPDLLVAEASIWSVFEKELVGNGRREGKPFSMGGDCFEVGLNQQLTLESEQDEFLNWLARHFGNDHTYTMIQMGSSESPNFKPFDNMMASFRRIGTQNPDWAACAFDKESLSPVPADMICNHGCDGPATMIQAQAILRSALLK